MDLNKLAEEIHYTAVDRGWWIVTLGTPRTFAEQVANYHAEISEAWEEYRDGRAMTEIRIGENGKPEGIPIELADTIIRILDTCGAYTIDIDAAVRMKMRYNEGRPYRHGGKIA